MRHWTNIDRGVSEPSDAWSTLVIQDCWAEFSGNAFLQDISSHTDLLAGGPSSIRISIVQRDICAIYSAYNMWLALFCKIELRGDRINQIPRVRLIAAPLSSQMDSDDRLVSMIAPSTKNRIIFYFFRWWRLAISRFARIRDERLFHLNFSHFLSIAAETSISCERHNYW
jgi:hypothetical protein